MKRRDLLGISTSYLALLVFSLATGCSQFQSPQPQNPNQPQTPSSVSVTITPQSLGIKHGDSWNFAATVTNRSDQTVTWSVQEGSSGGTITVNGGYTAPAADGVYHVIATSKADPSKSATAIVTVGDTGFALTGSLEFARSLHTATLLQNGNVFIGGGAIETTDPNVDDGFTVIDTVEVFDPNTGVFQTAGKLKRYNLTATLLQNGDVLFAGGNSEDTSTVGDTLTATAELLKAGSGTLQPTGSMALERSHHTATLLQDGRVLITGGYVVPWPTLQSTRTAELYDPASGTFTQVGDMGAPRAYHLATLLPNGKVLITGGGTPQAELFDPATQSFTFTGSTSSDSVQTATLLTDGRVLVTGEATGDGLAPAPSELYDPATGKFTPTGTMATLRDGYSATLLPDGTVLLAGGEIYVSTGEPGSYAPGVLNMTEIYNPATGSFSPGPTMRQGRVNHTATLLPDGSVLFVGGWGQGDLTAYTPLASAEVYR